MAFVPSTPRSSEYGRITDLQEKMRGQVAEMIEAAQKRLNSKQYLAPGQSPQVRNEAWLAPNDTYMAGHKAALWLAAAAQYGHKDLLASARDIEAGIRAAEDKEVYPFYRPGFSEDPNDIQKWYDRAITALDRAGGRDKKHFKGIYVVFNVHTDPREQQERRDLLKKEQPITSYVDERAKENLPTYTDPEGTKTPEEQAEEERQKKFLIYGAVALGIAGGIYWAVSKD
jgi:hypothetical protein